MLQKTFAAQFEYSFPDEPAPKIMVIPSLTPDQQILEKIEGITHYEERMLCLLLLFSKPKSGKPQKNEGFRTKETPSSMTGRRQV